MKRTGEWCRGERETDSSSAAAKMPGPGNLHAETYLRHIFPGAVEQCGTSDVLQDSRTSSTVRAEHSI